MYVDSFPDVKCSVVGVPETDCESVGDATDLILCISIY